jgi:hypothetical protein
MDTIIRTIYRLLQCMIVIVMGASTSLTAHAQAIDETTVKQLRELKELCDEGLVSEEVCLEKQRSILDLGDNSSKARPALESSEATKEDTQAKLRDFGGLSFTLPEGWQRIDSQEMEVGFQALENQLQGADEAKRQIQELASTLKIAGTEAFKKPGATLLVRPQAAALQISPTSVNGLCQQLAGAFSAGKERVMYDCGVREVAGNETIYLEHDSLADDARTIMYLAAIGPGKTVQFVLNSENQSLESNKLELEDIIASVGWK